MSNEGPKPKKKRVVRSAFIDHSYHDYADAPNQYPGIVSNATLATDHVNHSVAKKLPRKASSNRFDTAISPYHWLVAAWPLVGYKK
ncbi:hypothetical protein HJC23_011361 [Cyclotella cryptica]|uniref:Uncharacterized protein n=1 Tax=Cyclotella cryptica TaxID=29204 RepID=A0ABD3PUV0_9STRA